MPSRFLTFISIFVSFIYKVHNCQFTPVSLKRIVPINENTTITWTFNSTNSCTLKQFTISTTSSSIVLISLTENPIFGGYTLHRTDEDTVVFFIKHVGIFDIGDYSVKAELTDVNGTLKNATGKFEIDLEKEGDLISFTNSPAKNLPLTVMIAIILGIPLCVAAISVLVYDLRKKHKLRINRREHAAALRAMASSTGTVSVISSSSATISSAENTSTAV